MTTKAKFSPIIIGDRSHADIMDDVRKRLASSLPGDTVKLSADEMSVAAAEMTNLCLRESPEQLEELLNSLGVKVLE